MPIYEYQCENCGKAFEKLVRMSAGDAEVECPACGSKNTRKALSLFGVGAGKGSSSLSSAGSSCGSSGST
jgi:putative FmdB family regulatory protein